MENNKNTMNYFERTEGVEKEIYYHYTSVSALFNIVCSKTFWLTNLKSSNDKKELSYSLKEFVKDFCEIVDEEQDEKRKTKLALSREYMKDKTRSFMPIPDVFSLSLCYKGDDLTHWDRYAWNSTGVSIGINTAALRIYYSRLGIYDLVYNLLRVQEISYDSDDRKDILNRYIDAYYEDLRDIEEQYGDEFWEDIFPRYLFAIYFEMRLYVKLSAFIDEDEVRVLFRSKMIDTIENIIEREKTKIPENAYVSVKENYAKLLNETGLREKHFSMFGTGIRSYHSLCLKEIWGNGLIPEIILGPKCTQDKKELRAFLDSHGLKGTKIIQSKVPLR